MIRPEIKPKKILFCIEVLGSPCSEIDIRNLYERQFTKGSGSFLGFDAAFRNILNQMAIQGKSVTKTKNGLYTLVKSGSETAQLSDFL